MIEALSITMRQGFLFLDGRKLRGIGIVNNISKKEGAT
jgi:hypothetical protein